MDEEIFFTEEQQIFFFYKKANTSFFEKNLYSYLVFDTDEFGMYNISDIHSPFTVISHKLSNGEKYLMLRHAL